MHLDDFCEELDPDCGFWAFWELIFHEPGCNIGFAGPRVTYVNAALPITTILNIS